VAWVDKTRAAVKARLTKETMYWDHRAQELADQERAGKPNAKLNSQEARRRADELHARLQKRLEQLDREAQISALPPVVMGGCLIIPAGLLASMGAREVSVVAESVDKQAVAARAREIIMAVECQLGFEPVDRETEKLGYDIESRDPKRGGLRFIEVKGRTADAETVTVTRNEILYSLNEPESFILAIVEFLPEGNHRVHYLRNPFRQEPDFGVTSVNYDMVGLIARAGAPS
jgi:hypothetical protein